MSLDDRIRDLKRDYLRIGAGPGFAERVAARAPTGRRPGVNWLPAAAAAAAALVAAVLVLQPGSRQPPDRTQQRLALSMPAMPGAVRKPPGMQLKLPSLTRTRALPVLPPTPTRNDPKPRTNTSGAAATRV